MDTNPKKSKSWASSSILKPLSESVIAAREREVAIASLDIIEAFYRLKPLERSFIEAILKQLRGEKTVFTIDRPAASPEAEEDTKETRSADGKRKKPQDTVEESLSRLAYYHRPVMRDQVNSKTINWHTHWLCGYADLDEDKTLVSLDQRLLPHLRILKSYLARRSFSARFTSQYSVRLYEWAWQHRKARMIRVTLQELRQILGVNETRNEKTGAIVQEARLTLWPNLKQRALERAVKEITRKSDLAIRVIGYGREKYRKVTDVRFEILVKAEASAGSAG